MASYGRPRQGDRPRKHGGPWTTAENELLTYLVSRCPSAAQLHWVEIARDHGTRDAKQCRERWDNHLKPGLNREKITDDEGDQLLQWVREHGKHWAPLGRMVNRPENMVKNYFYQENKKAERGITKHRHRLRNRLREQQDRLPASTPMSRDNSAASSHQPYGRSASPMYAPAPVDYNNQGAAGPYYPASPYAPYQYPSRRTSVASIITNPPSLTSDHGSPAESPRAGADIPYPPGHFALPPYQYPPPVDVPLASHHGLAAEGAAHKRSGSASSYGSVSLLHPLSPITMPIRTAFPDRPMQPPPKSPTTAIPSRWTAQLASGRNPEQPPSASRKDSDTRMSIWNVIS